jgi:gas vesicle protein
MINIIEVSPKTRINDQFVSDDSMNASPPENIVTRHPLITGVPNESLTRYQADFYKYIAVDIVVETVLNYPYPYISEKTLRPLACKRMLIVLGAPGTLKLLKSKGFVTFDDFINESYDDIQNTIDRFNAVEKEIKKICDTPLGDIKDYMKNNSEKFEHNFSVLVNLQNNELKQIAETLDIK